MEGNAKLLRKFSKLLPAPLRANVWEILAKAVREIDFKSAQKIEESLPKIDLSMEQMKNLKVLTDKPTLLNFLPKHSIVGEVGVSRGKYSEKILAVAQPKKLYLIDSWGNEFYKSHKKIVEDLFKKEVSSGQVIICQGISTVVLEKFEDGLFDWVYLDSDHGYENVARELEICRKKVKVGGIIAGHDYVTGQWLKRERYGVVEAVNEFCNKYNWEMIYLTNEHHRNLSYALREITS